MPIIEIKNLNNGGIADSDILGGKDSVAEAVGLDIHSKPGFLRANQKLTEDAPSGFITEKTIGIPCSDGNSYHFGAVTGKVWKRDVTGGWSLIATVTPGSGTAGILGAAEYQGYIYYGMSNRLGRWQIGSAWSSREDNFGTFRNGNAQFHPMLELNLVLFIGDGYNIAQVDSTLQTIDYGTLTGTFEAGEKITGGTSGATAYIDSDDGSMLIIKEVVGVFQAAETITGSTSGATATVTTIVTGVFSENALDLPVQSIVKCLGPMGTDLLIGTIVNSNIIGTKIYRWNTWSVSYTNSDPIPEVGINAFLPTDNFVIVNAGTKGNLYIYDGSTLDIYKQVKGDWSASDKALVHPQAVLNFNGLPLFGMSSIIGNPTIMGIYSLGRTNRNYPYVLNCEYLLASRDIANIEIFCITPIDNSFLVSWKNGSTYGIDRMDLTEKFNGAYFTTRIIMPDRMALTNFSQIFSGYRRLPTGTLINFEKSVNYQAFVPISDIRTDTKRNMRYSAIDIGEATTLQARAILQTSGNDSPEMEITRIKIKDNG